MNVRIVFTGRGYHATSSLPDEIVLPDGARVADALRVVEEHLAEDASLPRTCLVTVAGEHLGSVARFADRPLKDGEEIVLIAPVAGG